MTSCQTTRKKTNCFEALNEAVYERKDPDTIEPSGITKDPAILDNKTPTKETFASSQNKMDEQFEEMEYAFNGIAEALTVIHDPIEDIHSIPPKYERPKWSKWHSNEHSSPIPTNAEQHFTN